MNKWYYLKLKLVKYLPDRNENQKLIKSTLIELVDQFVGEEE